MHGELKIGDGGDGGVGGSSRSMMGEGGCALNEQTNKLPVICQYLKEYGEVLFAQSFRRMLLWPLQVEAHDIDMQFSQPNQHITRSSRCSQGPHQDTIPLTRTESRTNRRYMGVFRKLHLYK